MPMMVKWCHAETKVPPRESDSIVEWPAPPKSLISLVILDERTADYSFYIKNVLSVALKYENEVFGDK